jgi:RNA recognition motif-containing protein
MAVVSSLFLVFMATGCCAPCLDGRAQIVAGYILGAEHQWALVIGTAMQVVDVKVIVDRSTGLCKGFAFVTMANGEDVRSALFGAQVRPHVSCLLYMNSKSP